MSKVGCGAWEDGAAPDIGLTASVTRPSNTAVGRVVSSAHGPLAHLLVWFPREAAVRRGYLEVYADLLAQLPITTRLTVLVHPGAVDTLTGLVEHARPQTSTRVVLSREDLRFSVWAQDPCLALQDDGDGVRLLVSSGFDRQQDLDAIKVTAAAIGAEVVLSPLAFHGGDVLAGDSFVLVGRHSIDATVATFDDDPSVAVAADRHALARERFADLLAAERDLHVVGATGLLPEHRTRRIRVRGRDVVEILPGGGQSPHPLIHLDMFLTLAGRGPDGRYRVLVGSTVLADELLGRTVVDEALGQQLDEVAAQLAAEGFVVIRNPLPLTYGDGRREIDGQRCDVRLWYLATANNCLVQLDEDAGRKVWLPTYGHGAWRELAVTDEANRRIWEQLGVAVHQLPSFHTFTQRFGALHCITKDLERRPVP